MNQRGKTDRLTREFREKLACQNDLNVIDSLSSALVLTACNDLQSPSGGSSTSGGGRTSSEWADPTSGAALADDRDQAAALAILKDALEAVALLRRARERAVRLDATRSLTCSTKDDRPFCNGYSTEPHRTASRLRKGLCDTCYTRRHRAESAAVPTDST